MAKRKLFIMVALLSSSWLGCSSEAQVFNQSFINLFAGSNVPLTPGPDAGYVMAYVINNTNQSIEFVVTAQAEEVIVRLDNGVATGFDPPRLLEPATVNLRTDALGGPTLAIVFDNTPVDFPPAPPGGLTFQDIQSAINQLAQKDPESLTDRPFVRLVRVLRLGLGPNLDVPSGEDDGLIVREAGADPDTTAGSVFPSRVNNALSYAVGADPADFGNGDMVIFLATTSATAVGGIRVTPGVVDGQQANAAAGGFVRDTFDILRRAEGPISPLPPN